MDEAEHERAAIVAWMRDPDRSDWATRYMAKAIEQGEHIIEGFLMCCCKTCISTKKPVRYTEDESCPGCNGVIHDMEPHPAVRRPGVVWL